MVKQMLLTQGSTSTFGKMSMENGKFTAIFGIPTYH